MPATIQRYSIESIDSSVSGIKVFRLAPVEGTVLRFQPGQWAFLHLLDEKGGTAIKKPYSIASSPDSAYLEFGIEMAGGELTSKLDALGPGAVVGVEGPFGRFTYNGEKKAAFIAGGVGITPFMGMLRHIAASGLKGEFILFYSAKTLDRSVYADELKGLCKKNPCIKVVMTLTRETPKGWAGECGRLNHGMITKYAAKPADFEWWVCGPAELVKSMKACLADMGVDPKKIKLEGWG